MGLSGNRIGIGTPTVTSATIDGPPRGTIPAELYVGRPIDRSAAALIASPAFERMCVELAKGRIPRFEDKSESRAATMRLMDGFFGSSDKPITVMGQRVRALSNGRFDVISTPLEARTGVYQGLTRCLTLVDGKAQTHFLVTQLGCFLVS